MGTDPLIGETPQGRMAGIGPKSQRGGTWVYTPIGEALAMVGLEEIRVYIACH